MAKSNICVYPFVSLVLGILLMSTASMASTLKERFNVTPGGTLDLRTDVGSLQIETHTDDSVDMQVVIKGYEDDEFVVTSEAKNGNLRIVGEKTGRNDWGHNRSVKFKLRVPEKYQLKLDTAGGSIRISDLHGNIDAHTSGGSIKVGNITGQVKLDTSGGSIGVEAVSGPVNAKTSGGSIKVRITEQLTADSELKTSGGSITATIPQNMQIDINARTSGGRVHSDFEIDGSTKKQYVNGKINGGGPELTLRTSGGSIRIQAD